MRAYLVPLWQTDDTVRRIEIPEFGTVGVYRSSDGNELYVDEPDTTRELRIRDRTVSRKKGGDSPVTFWGSGGDVKIRNHTKATNEVSVQIAERDMSISPGESIRVSESSEIEFGFNASVRLTIEQDSTQTLTRDELKKLVETKSGGVSHAAYAQSVATNLRKSSAEAPNECLKFATDLHNFLRENPVETDEHSRISTEVKKLVDKLEMKISADPLDSRSLDDEQQERIDRIAHHVTTIYAKSSE